MRRDVDGTDETAYRDASGPVWNDAADRVIQTVTGSLDAGGRVAVR